MYSGVHKFKANTGCHLLTMYPAQYRTTVLASLRLEYTIAGAHLITYKIAIIFHGIAHELRDTEPILCVVLEAYGP